MSVVVFPRGQLTSEDKTALLVHDIVAVECDDPSKVVTVLPATSLSGDRLLTAAINAIASSSSSYPACHFVEKLDKFLGEKES